MAQRSAGLRCPRGSCCTEGGEADSRGVERQVARRLPHPPEVHLKLIKEHFGAVPLTSVKPSDVRGWTAQLKAEGRADSYTYALHVRLSQLFSDAVHDGIVPRNPCSRRTSPGTGKQRPYVATTEQVWALYNAVPAGIRPGSCSAL